MIILIILTTLVASFTSGLIMPASRSERSDDLISDNPEMKLVEQMVLDLLSEVRTTNTELEVAKDELVAMKTELLSTTSELISVKDEMKHLNVTVITTSNELVAVKDELFAVKTELISVKGELNNLSATENPNRVQMNTTVLDMISSDVKTNIRDIATLKSDLLYTLKDVSESKIKVEDLRIDLTDVNTSISNSAENLHHKQQTLENRVNILEQLRTEVNMTNGNIVHSRHNVKYEVVCETHLKSVPVQHILKFDHVIFNDGLGYNLTTGTFTAPVSGTYLFWANMLINGRPGDYINIALYIRTDRSRFASAPIAAGAYIGNATHDTVDIMYVTDLEAGNQVWIQKVSGNETYINGYLYSSYGGVLLHTH